MINGTSWLVVTKLDVLDEQAGDSGLRRLQDRRQRDAADSGADFRLREDRAGLHQAAGLAVEHLRHRQLRSAAAEGEGYLEFVEKESGAKIGIISTGPDREQTMFVPEFAKVLDGISGKQ